MISPEEYRSLPVDRGMNWAGVRAVARDVNEAVYLAANNTVNEAVNDVVTLAVYGTMSEAVREAVNEAFRRGFPNA